MDEQWRRRSYNQICESGEVNVCVPCIDTAALATAYLESKRTFSEIVLLTEQGAAERFKAGRKAKLHLDAAAGFMTEGKKYWLDIGAGDISLMKHIAGSDNNVSFATTRYDEPKWGRTIIARVQGSELMRNKQTPLVELLLQQRTTPLPFGLTKEDFFRVNHNTDDGDRFYHHAQEYNAEIERAKNEGWTEGVQHVFPGLKPFNYAD